MDDGATKELYNLKNDLSEKNNVISQFPKVTEEIDTFRIQWKSKLIDPVFLGLIHTEAWQKRMKNGKK